jgi:pilus assembly protein CpaE
MSEVQGIKGKMIVVSGAKGGIGKTMLSINLAISLYKKGLRVALWDGSFQFGDVDTSMDLHPAFTINDVVESIDTLDPFSLQNLMTKHISGVNVLPASKRPEYAELITPTSITKTAELLLQNYDYVIVDTGTGLNDQSLSLIEQADKILLMTTLDLVPIKNTKLVLEILQTLGLQDRVQMVINRSTMEGATPIEKVLETLQIDTAFYIPNNASLVFQSLNQGVPLVVGRSKSDVAKAIFKIAEGLDSNRLPSTVTHRKKPFFSKVLGRA